VNVIEAQQTCSESGDLAEPRTWAADECSSLESLTYQQTNKQTSQ